MNKDYKSNSYKSKEESKNPKNVEKIVSGEVHTKKKGEFSKFLGLFTSEDIEDFKDHILFDVLVPGIKKTIEETVHTFLFGSADTRRIESPKASYMSYWGSSNSKSDRSYSKRTYDYDDVVFKERGEAEKVLDAMYDMLREYENVSVFDLYEMSGLESNYTYNNYGWTSLSGSSVIRLAGGGFKLQLPPATRL